MIIVVTGPPCSGKSTYVRTHAQPGDLVIDFDTLAQAFGSPTPHQHPSHVRHVALQARRTAIDAALAVHHNTTVWIVDCTISTQRARVYKQAGAKIVTLAAERGELHRRAAAERPALWHGLIDAWQPNPDMADSDTTAGSRDW